MLKTCTIAEPTVCGIILWVLLEHISVFSMCICFVQITQYVLWLFPWQYYSCTSLLHVISLYGLIFYLAALLLMEIVFFVVLYLMNIIKINLLTCASLCIFVSFSQVSIRRWDCWVCGMHTLNFDSAIWALEWLNQFSCQSSVSC